MDKKLIELVKTQLISSKAYSHDDEAALESRSLHIVNNRDNYPEYFTSIQDKTEG